MMHSKDELINNGFFLSGNVHGHDVYMKVEDDTTHTKERIIYYTVDKQGILSEKKLLTTEMLSVLQKGISSLKPKTEKKKFSIKKEIMVDMTYRKLSGNTYEITLSNEKDETFKLGMEFEEGKVPTIQDVIDMLCEDVIPAIRYSDKQEALNAAQNEWSMSISSMDEWYDEAVDKLEQLENLFGEDFHKMSTIWNM